MFTYFISQFITVAVSHVTAMLVTMAFTGEGGSIPCGWQFSRQTSTEASLAAVVQCATCGN